MAASLQSVHDAAKHAGFPMANREYVVGIVMLGLENYRAGKTRRYVSHTGKIVKKPKGAHAAPVGRTNQTQARTILISALCRAWIHAMNQKPTLNHKAGFDSPFFRFAQSVMGAEGIGNIHRHLEEYWSIRKKTWLDNPIDKKMANFRGE